MVSIYKTTAEQCLSSKSGLIDYGYQSSLEMKWFYGDQVPKRLKDRFDEN